MQISTTRSRFFIAATSIGIFALAAVFMRSTTQLAPTSDGEPHTLQEHCATDSLHGTVPSGFVERIVENDCIRYAHPEAYGAPAAASPLSLHVLDAQRSDDYITLWIAEEASGSCHVPPHGYTDGCLTLDDVQRTYDPVGGARADAFIGPAVRAYCEAAITCVIRQAHIVTTEGRWLTFTAYVAEDRYDRGADIELLDIIRSIDAR